MRNKPAIDASNKRLRRRHLAETRLKAYGLLALLIAAAALVTLLWSVVGKAGNALSESYITLPVRLDATALDPKGGRNAKTILRADFAALTKKSLRAAFPDIKKRKDKKALYGLLSGGASFELAQKIAANPALLGQVIRFDFLASDVADLYLKGAYGGLVHIADAPLQISKKGRTYHLRATSSVFQPLLADVKLRERAAARRLTAQAAREDAGRLAFLKRAQDASDPAARAAAQKEAKLRAGRRDALRARVAALLTAAGDKNGAVKLGRKTRAVLVKTDQGWLRLRKMAPDRAEGRLLVAAPLGATGTGNAPAQIYETAKPAAARKFSDKQMIWMRMLGQQNRVKRVFNWRFFTASDSREPELAGIRGALMGTLLTMLVTFVLAFPMGVMAAIYLEEFAPKGRLTNFIEVNINNLAAVPSIVFGLLGLAVFIGFFGVPRSAPLAGGIVLALMTMPTIIIAARAALRAVPPSIRDAALGVGASKIQATFHHVLPLAMPGILTGAIIGMAQALGETAPLIMVGMVAFIVDVPHSIIDSATVLPVQVFRWSDFPERAFEARTALAILVLLGVLVAMNALAIVLRKRFERRW